MPFVFVLFVLPSSVHVVHSMLPSSSLLNLILWSLIISRLPIQRYGLPGKSAAGGYRWQPFISHGPEQAWRQLPQRWQQEQLPMNVLCCFVVVSLVRAEEAAAAEVASLSSASRLFAAGRAAVDWLKPVAAAAP